MNWKLDTDPNMDYLYHTVKIGEDKLSAFAAWWVKIAELSEGKEDWNVIVADMWIDNSGRIIGHIQRYDQAVGYDRGFRVALTIEDWVDRLNLAFESDNERLYNNTLNQLYGEAEVALRDAIMEPAANQAIKALHAQNPFTVHIAIRGYCDFNDGESMIDF